MHPIVCVWRGALVKIVLPQDLRSHVGLGANKARTIPDFPQPVQLTSGRIGWLAHELDNWLTQRAAEREQAAPKPVAEGRKRYWQEVRDGKRLHPRTHARLKREAEKATAEAE